MANIISDETMEYVGILAKLELSEEEKEQAKKDMETMLDYIDQLNEYICGNMELVENFIRDELKDFKFQRPEATYLAWIDARDVPFTSDEIQDALVNVGGVAIMKGEIYGENGAKYLRMNLGCPRSKIEEGLKRFKKAMDYLYNK